MLIKIIIPYVFFLTILVVIYFSYVSYNKKRMASIARIKDFMVSNLFLEDHKKNIKLVELMMTMSVAPYIDEFVNLRKKVSDFDSEANVKDMDIDSYFARINAIKNECANRLDELPRNSVKECIDSVSKLKKNELIDVMFESASPLVSSFSKI